jgi:hypothetical protein
MSRPKTKSSSGFWNVELARKVEVASFTYMPGHAHTVDDATLKAMREKDSEAVASATEAR